MLRRMSVLLALFLVSSSVLGQSAPDMFKDVPRDHWSYPAIESLRSRGILIGYPDDYFQGKRTLTRYEFAVALDRALQSVLGATRPSPTKRVEPQSFAGFSAAASAQDLGSLRRLTAEFRGELVALGMDVSAITRRLEDAAGNRPSAGSLSPGALSGAGQLSSSNRPFGGLGVEKAGPLRLGMDPRLGASFPATYSNSRFYGDLTQRSYDPLSARLPGFSLAPVAAASPGPPNSTSPGFLSEGSQVPDGDFRFTPGRFSHLSGGLDVGLAGSGTTFSRNWDTGNTLSITGARLRTSFGILSLEAYGGSANGVTAGPGGSSPYAGTPLEPLGRQLFPFSASPTAAVARQITGISAGVGLRVLDGARLRLSASDLTGSASAGIEGVQTVGADVSLRLTDRVSLFGDWGKSIARTGRVDAAVPQFNNAFNAAVQYDTGSLNLSAGYRYVDPNYFAPGYWGRIGSWLNPTNIAGPTVRAAWDISPRFGINVGGEMLSAARDRALQGGLSDNDTITRALVGIRWNLSQSLETTFDWEGVYWQRDGSQRLIGATGPSSLVGAGSPFRIHPSEQYFTLGTGYSLASNAKLRLLYQVGTYDGRGFLLSSPGLGPRNPFNVLTGQVAVKF